MSRPLRIAMLTHSTNPRGGVVHAMQLSEALTAVEHHVVLHAPDVAGRGLFRQPACGAVSVPAAAAASDMTAMVEQRIADYVAYFEKKETRDFDIFHAHDGISGNALATLKEKGLIAGFVRTVHHIDQFDDPRLMVLQDRSIDCADMFLTVSALWQKTLALRGLSATVVGNGVDRARFFPNPRDPASNLRKKLGIPDGPVFLCVGGIEERKNTIRMLEAFRQMRAVRPDAQLVIAGGASLLNHSKYQKEFRIALDGLADQAGSVHILGAISDEDMPGLYQLADTLVFASIKEGFGLVILEAMASAVPVVVSSISPFKDYIRFDEAIWCDPTHPASIAEAMAVSLMPPIRRELIPKGLAMAERYSWENVAALHQPVYASLRETANA